MKETVVVDKALIKEAMATIAEKTAQLDKLAALVEELSVYKRVAELVSIGVIDPSDTLDKVAEFRAEPTKLDFFEKKSQLQWDSCVSLDGPASGVTIQGSPEEQFQQNLESILLN